MAKQQRRARRWRPRASSIVLGLVVVAVGIQFVPYSVDNPATRDEPTWESPRTRQLFMAACGDCHSNQTKVLWFEHIAPVKWYVANHVKEGRSALNIDTWHSQAGEEADEMLEVIREGSMPPASYTYLGLHSDAKLTDAEKSELLDGLRTTMTIDPPRGSD